MSARQISAGLAKKLTGSHADRSRAINAAIEGGGAGAGKGKRKNVRSFLASARELGVELDGPTWKKLLDAWKRTK